MAIEQTLKADTRRQLFKGKFIETSKYTRPCFTLQDNLISDVNHSQDNSLSLQVRY